MAAGVVQRYSWRTMVEPLPGRPAARRAAINYSPLMQRVLGACALALAIMPAPIAAWGLLPVYHWQARFLVFYGPVIGLLMLAYLVYVRDLLARLMFAHLLRPLPPPDPYYVESIRDRAVRNFYRLRTLVVASLPAVLLAASVFCVTRYLSRFNASVQVAQKVQSSARQSEVLGYAPEVRSRGGESTSALHADSTQVVPPEATSEGRDAVLASTVIGDIPYFGELTVLYLGIFVCALAGVIVMALREYAKEALGISEKELVLGASRAVFEE
jgi:hypothetical protein